MSILGRQQIRSNLFSHWDSGCHSSLYLEFLKFIVTEKLDLNMNSKVNIIFMTREWTQSFFHKSCYNLHKSPSSSETVAKNFSQGSGT